MHFDLSTWLTGTHDTTRKGNANSHHETRIAGWGLLRTRAPTPDVQKRKATRSSTLKPTIHAQGLVRQPQRQRNQRTYACDFKPAIDGHAVRLQLRNVGWSKIATKNAAHTTHTELINELTSLALIPHHIDAPHSIAKRSNDKLIASISRPQTEMSHV